MTDRHRALADYPYVVADTETDGLDWRFNKAFGISICTPDGDAEYYDLRNDDDYRYVAGELPRARKVVNHNIKFDLHMLHSAGIRIDPARVVCTMVVAALLNEHERSYSLDSLAQKYVGVGKDDRIWEDLAGIFGGDPTKKAQVSNLPRAPRELVARYANGDTLATLALWKWQEPQIAEQELMRVFDVERRLLGVLYDIERSGVAVDLERAKRASVELRKRERVLQDQLNGIAGTKVNYNSNAQVAKLLVDGPNEDGSGFLAVDGRTVFPPTDSGKAASIRSEQLYKMEHPVAQLIVELRSINKTVDTFLEGHILGYQYGGRVNCNYNQTKSDNDLGTGSGRLSVNSPAMQQIPKRNKHIAPFVRGCFIPNEGQEWCTIDWSQMDFRIFAEYAKSPPVLALYAENPDADYHGMIANLVGIPRDRAPGTGGGNAKQINLGMVFGMSAGRMAMEMGLPFYKEKGKTRDWLRPGEQAEAVFAKYHDAVPGVRDLLARASSIARDRGFVKTKLGRRIRFPGGQFTHKAAGLVFQGTAADCLKQKLVEVHELLKGTGSSLLVNVHDEFDISMPRDADELKSELIHVMEGFGPGDAIPLRVPIRCSLSMGADWWEASGVAPDIAADYRKER